MAAQDKKLKTMSTKHRADQILLHAVLILIAVLVISPLLLLVFNSFKNNNEILNNPTALPTSFTLQYIVKAMNEINFWRSLGVTFIVTFFSVALLVLVSSFAAWGMTRAKSKLSDFMYLCFTAAMLIPFQSLMYPLVSIAEKAGAKNIPGLIFMYGGFGISMSIFLYHGFFKNVPISLEESAMLDGANIFEMFFKVVMPLMKSTTVTVIVINAMWIWNDYLLPFLVIGNSDKTTTLTLELYFAKLKTGQYGNPWELIFPAVFVTIIPIIIIYILLQKWIINGVIEGAVKG
ncbi:carbohydrate ABC transporter permease [Bacillota bacterium LCP21S3_D9]